MMLSLNTRVFLGGGFTKDYLYLGGFRNMVSLSRKRDITSLFTGKTSIQFLDIVTELIERKIFISPQFDIKGNNNSLIAIK